MDLLTQGLAGAVLAQSAARREQVRSAVALGFVAGMLPDADALIRSSADPLLTLEYHRQFTHALVFVPFGALIAALLAWPLLRRRLPFPQIYGYALLGILPSGLLDAGTSYGTQLLWPFADARISWNVIAIIDPLFTVALLTGLIVGLVRRSSAPARAAALLAVAYLGIGVLQRERVETFARELAQGRGHEVERIEVKPTLGNLLLWRTIYRAGEYFHVDAVRAGFSSTPRIYPGGTLPRFRPEQLAGLAPESVLARDIRRFQRFSDGYVARHPGRGNILGDVRYAMRPNGLEPLWGIEFDPAAPAAHVDFRTFRELTPDTRSVFFAMLAGEPLPGNASTSPTASGQH